MQKSDIRKIFKEKRRLLSAEEKAILSRKIASVVVDNLEVENKIISIFLPIERFNEVDTSYLIEFLKKSNCKIYTPVSDFSSLAMRHVIYNEKTIIQNSKWGIPEPIDGEEIEPNLFDVIFIPLLAVDNAGNRVGYGKGFYDRFLSQCKEDTVFVGLNYFEDVVEIENVTTEDISLHFLATPVGLRIFT